MRITLVLSKFAYACIVRSYPPGLRGEYGSDMIALFEEDLETALRSSWQAGVKRWISVLREVTQIALPWQLARASPAILGIVCSFVFYVSVLMAINPNRSCHKP